MSPSQIDTHGGTLVKISGINFAGTPTVTIGGVAATVAWVESSTVLYAVAPAHAAAAGLDVVVTTGGGPSTGGEGLVEAWYPDQITGARIYDPERGVTDSSGVSAVVDQGAGGKNLSASGGAKPTYAPNALGTRHAFLFAGGQELDVAAPVGFTSVSRFATGRWTGLANAGEIIAGDGSGVVDWAFDKYGSTYGMRMFEANAGVNHDQGAGLNDGLPHVLGQVLDASDQPNSVLNMYIDGAPATGAPQTFATYGTPNWWKVGNGVGNPLHGYLGPIVVVENVVSSGNRAKIFAWMRGQFVQQTPISSQISTGQYTPRDGAWLLRNPSDAAGMYYMLSGWNDQGGGAFPGPSSVTNEILKTTDYGATWTTFLAQDLAPPANRPPAQHAVGYIIHKGYAYQCGGDGFYSGYHAKIYRAPLADLTTWELVATGPWTPDALACWFSLNGSLYKVGGQTDLNSAASAHAHVYRSDDDGVTWTQIGDAPMVGGVINNPIPVAMVDGKLQAIFVGGGVYDEVTLGNRVYRNAVRVFDGTTWTTKIAEGAAPFPIVQYNSVVVFRDRVWLINGFGGSGAPGAPTNTRATWSAPLTDLTTWREEIHLTPGQNWTTQPWQTSHADGVAVDADRILLGPGNGGIGDGAGTVYKVQPIAY